MPDKIMNPDWPSRSKQRAAQYTRECRQRRRDMLDAIKLESGCVDCGYNAHRAALDFDHVRGEKLFGLGQASRYRLEQVMAEIEKCEVRCANCHRIRTVERRAA